MAGRVAREGEIGHRRHEMCPRRRADGQLDGTAVQRLDPESLPLPRTPSGRVRYHHSRFPRLNTSTASCRAKRAAMSRLAMCSPMGTSTARRTATKSSEGASWRPRTGDSTRFGLERRQALDGRNRVLHLEEATGIERVEQDGVAPTLTEVVRSARRGRGRRQSSSGWRCVPDRDGAGHAPGWRPRRPCCYSGRAGSRRECGRGPCRRIAGGAVRRGPWRAHRAGRCPRRRRLGDPLMLTEGDLDSRQVERGAVE